MNLAILRVSGDDDALVDIAKSLGLVICRKWNVGEVNRAGQARDKSSFNAEVVDAENREELEKSIRVFLRECQAKRISFASAGLFAELDVGIGVGLEKQFTGGVGFTPSDLAIFGEIGLELKVSAYPISNDDEERESKSDT